MYQFRIKRDKEELINFLDDKNDRNNYLVSLIEKSYKERVFTLKELKQIIKPILNKYEIYEIYLFGSYSRGEATEDSDIDILCEKGNIETLIDQGCLEDELEEALQKEVDIVFTSSKMDEYFRSQIMEDLIKLC